MKREYMFIVGGIIFLIGASTIAWFAGTGRLQRWLPSKSVQKAAPVVVDEKQKELSTASPYVLYVTTPVLTFQGRLDKIEGNTLRVSRSIPPAASQKARNPASDTKEITIAFAMTDETAVTRASIPGQADANNGKPVPLQVSDLTVGQLVSVTTLDDLRFEETAPREATEIQVQTRNFLIAGVIKKIEDKTLSLFTNPPPDDSLPQDAQVLKPHDYTVSVLENTQIIYDDGGNAGLGDLKPNIFINIYTNEDPYITNALTAAKILIKNQPNEPPK